MLAHNTKSPLLPKFGQPVRSSVWVDITYRCVPSSRMIVKRACSCNVGGRTIALSGSSAWLAFAPEAGKHVVIGFGETMAAEDKTAWSRARSMQEISSCINMLTAASGRCGLLQQAAGTLLRSSISPRDFMPTCARLLINSTRSENPGSLRSDPVSELSYPSYYPPILHYVPLRDPHQSSPHDAYTGLRCPLRSEARTYPPTSAPSS